MLGMEGNDQLERLRRVLSDCVDRNSLEEVEDLDVDILQDEMQSCPYLRACEMQDEEIRFLASCVELSTDDLIQMLSCIGVKATEEDISEGSASNLSVSEFSDLIDQHPAQRSTLEKITSFPFSNYSDDRKNKLLALALLFTAALCSFE